MSDYPGPPRPEPAAPVDGVGMFCANCHAPMPPDADFCNRCGAPRLTRDTSATQVLPVARPRATETVVEEDIRHDVPYVRTPPPTNWWPLAALGILGALILLLVLFLVLDEDDDDVVDPTTTTLVPLTTAPTAPLPAPAPAPASTQPPQTVFVPVQPATTAPPTTTATTAPPTTAATTTAPPTTTATTAPAPGT